MDVGFTERGDDPYSSLFGRAKIHEQDQVFVIVNDFDEFCPQADQKHTVSWHSKTESCK